MTFLVVNAFIIFSGDTYNWVRSISNGNLTNIFTPDDWLNSSCSGGVCVINFNESKLNITVVGGGSNVSYWNQTGLELVPRDENVNVKINGTIDFSNNSIRMFFEKEVLVVEG